MEQAHIGRRVREIRASRGMEQQVVAQLAGITPAYLSMIERGLRPVNSRKLLESLARALRTSPEELTRRPESPIDPAAEAALAHVAAIEDVLNAWRVGETPDVEARPWRLVLAELDKLNLTLRPNADYDAEGGLLPTLIQDLLLGVNGAGQRRQALIGLIAAYKAVAYFAHDLRVAGLPALAVQRMQEAAERLEDPVWLSYANYQRAQLISGRNRQRQYDLAVQVAQTPGARTEVLGMAHLTAALAKAAQGDGDAARTHLDEATDLAERIEPDVSPWMQTNYGRVNVRIWKVSIGVELGAGAKVREVAAGLRLDGVSVSRQAAFWTDLGRGLVTDRKHRDAGLSALLRAEQLAPVKVRHNPFFRESVTTLLNAAMRDAGGPALRGLARRIGVPPTG
ncbi:helix-turn-helix transcriptional regulator [Saccharothrix sp.]|uniref:helix-turn-helix domain-containing protein n=1 Tax=Saccharothrix sp. TaxID=1873460 RepID=UPI002811ADE5|nr:helix-turn-helix transcriptional regulator [Saccharothrix sp.]